MDIFLISDNQVTQTTAISTDVPASGFLWLDATHAEVSAAPEAWRDAVERATGTHIYDPHLLDVANLRHPSYFDSTHDYAMVVFRKLALGAGAASAIDKDDHKRRVPAAIAKLATQPVAFLLFDHALVTVRAQHSRTIDTVRSRLLDYKNKPEGSIHATRLPTAPEDLMLRLLNAMVDQYLELRQPLTSQIDHWQRALLDPRRQFKDWLSLLDSRIELRRLDHLCEEQHDAMQELRDYLIEAHDGTDKSRTKDLLLVRVNDVMEHITRVLNHVRRLESSIESAVQIHFSAMAHRTSEIMRTLTVITALFMPLTLITGIFGMNFEYLPLLKDKGGFWMTIGGMAVIVIAMLLFFRRRRYLEDQAVDSRR